MADDRIMDDGLEGVEITATGLRYEHLDTVVELERFNVAVCIAHNPRRPWGRTSMPIREQIDDPEARHRRFFDLCRLVLMGADMHDVASQGNK